MSGKDQLIRFLFDKTRVRGELVQLEAAWQAILERHDYPLVVETLLGEALAATVLLGATIKFNGSLVLQIQGNGPINLLVVQLGSGGNVRATAEWRDLSECDPERKLSLPELFEDGRLAITVEPEKRGERYQGIVDLGTSGIREAIEGYFRQSEQINTRIWLASNKQSAAGLLIQEMPPEVNPTADPEDRDIWNRVCQLSGTVTSEELLALDMKTLMHRLYHEEDIRVFDPDLIHFRCSCSREKIVNVLKGLGQEDVQSILETEGNVSVSCEYCKLEYQFDAVDVEQIFTSETPPTVPKTRH